MTVHIGIKIEFESGHGSLLSGWSPVQGVLSPLNECTHCGESGVKLLLDLVADHACHLGHQQVQLGLQVPEELLLHLPLLPSPPLPAPPLVQVERPVGKTDQPEQAEAQPSKDDTRRQGSDHAVLRGQCHYRHF